MDSVFVGREAELEKAGELLEAARSGTESVLCIEGGPGMGKTTLTQRIVEMARDAGMLVLKGSFVDGQDLPPLWPWRRILTKAARVVESGPARELLTAHGPLVSHIEAEWENVPGLAQLPASQRKYRFFEWISSFLHELSRLTPLVIVLEDIHNGDDASIHLLQYLIDAQEFDPNFFLLSYRPEAMRGRPRLEEMKEQLRFTEHSGAISLAGFDRHELRQYLGQQWNWLTEEDVEHALSWTDGVPLRAFLYLERLGPELLRSPDPTKSLSELFWLSHRKGLDAASCKTVEQLALIGNAFTTAEIDAIAAGVGGGTGVRKELSEAGLIRADEEGVFHRFFHDELRVAVLDLLSRAERERLVAETAACIEAIPEAANARRTRLLKELYLSAHGRRFAGQAIRHTLDAVELAESQNAWPEVISDLKRLIKQHAASLDAKLLRNLKLRLCRAYHHSNNEPEGVPVAVGLYAELKAMGDREGLIDLVVNFGFGWAFGEVDIFTDIKELVGGLPGDHPKRPALLASVALSFGGGHETELAVTLSREAIELSRTRGDEATENLATVALVRGLNWMCRFEEALSTVDELLRDHSQRMGAEDLSFAHFARLFALQRLGRHSEFATALMEMQRLSRLYDDSIFRTNLRLAADRLALRHGDWQHLRLEEPKGTEVDFVLYLPAVTACYLTGRVEAADRFIEQFVRLQRAGISNARRQDKMFNCWFISLRAYLISDPRWLDECARYLPDLTHTFGDVPGYLTDFPICAARVSRRGVITVEEARSHYEHLLRAESYSFEEEEYSIAGAKALLALSWGDRELAIRHFEEAVAFCDKHEERPWRAHYLFELALLVAPAEAARSERLVEEATAEAERLGLKPLLERIGRGSSSADPPSAEALLPSGITRREREVLECLVEGLTDKEIAASLNISPHTVSNHLRNIYAKTESANRGEAVHWALVNKVARLDEES